MLPRAGALALSSLGRPLLQQVIGRHAAAATMSTTATGATRPVFPATTSAAESEWLTVALAPLLRRPPSPGSGSGSGRWALTPSGEGVERMFKFKTFSKTWDFMTAVSLQCKMKNHHPEWSNVYNTTFIRWTTHNPKGLSAKDIELAAACDSIASELGEIVEDAAQEDAAAACALRGVADRVVAGSGDCCTPPSKKTS